jgi:ribokinase
MQRPAAERVRFRAVNSGSVVVVGSINEDVELFVRRAPRPGETLTAERTARRAGGKGANQAVAAVRAGAQVRMIGRVGDDAAGERMIKDLRREGVDTDAVIAVPGVPTGAAYITVTADGENTIVLDPGANARLSADDLVDHREALDAAAVMLAQLEVPVDTVAAAVRQARDAGGRPVLTLAPAREVPDELLAGLDPLLVNEHEAGFLLGVADVAHDAAGSARRLLGRGPRSVVITLGAEGAVVADSDGVQRVPARAVGEVVDTTGAGDAFAGALACALAHNASLADAVHAGMTAGAQAVGRPGAR